MTDSPQVVRVRWRWALGICIVAAIALIVAWASDVSRQQHMLVTMIISVVTLFLHLVWAVLFSRFPGRARIAIFSGAAIVIIGLVNSLQISGVTGDLVPILRWRWKKAPTAMAESPRKAETAPRKVSTANFPQFLGPNRNGIIPGILLETNWTAHPPQELWRHAVGSAWTGFVVEDGIAVTQEQRGEDELVTAYELESGKLIWTHTDSTRYFTTLGGEGPRANPTIANKRIYTFGATGILNCLDLATGKAIWTINAVAEDSASVPSWGFAGAPLVHAGLVIVNVGGKDGRSLVAHDANTGKFVWGGGNDSAGYSSPTVMELAGSKLVVLFNHAQVEGHDLATGKILWEHPWRNGTPHCAMPIQITPNRLLASQGYGYGSELLEVTRTNEAWTVEGIWKSNRLKSKFANLVLYDGYVYGLDDGVLVCLDAATGERKWQGERHGHGQMLLVGEVILLMAENGEVLLIQLAPTEERPLAQFRALNSKTWNPPALAGEYLLVRNDLEAACFKVPLASRTSSSHDGHKL
jgi:outer membrane protein assembly factor BamB